MPSSLYSGVIITSDIRDASVKTATALRNQQSPTRPCKNRQRANASNEQQIFGLTFTQV